MLSFFKKDNNDNNAPADVKGLRDRVLQFIKKELGKAEGGEGAGIKALHLFVAAPETDKHLYEAALYADDAQRFKNEIQRIADDFAIELPADWNWEVQYVPEAPEGAVAIPGVQASLFVETRKKSFQRSATGYLHILQGEAEKEVYQLDSGMKPMNIGRERRVQADDGFFRINHIAFPAASANDANKYISRQHAHIEWNNDTARFYFFADEGGVPPRNKIKIRSAQASALIKLHTTDAGHPLEEGDQIILGESAVLLFSYSPEPH